MNKKILNTGVQDFISKNTNTDIVSVLLKKSPFEGITSKELAQQIESKKKSQKKLPTWFKTPGLYYPKKINIEQTSSEISAAYKAQIVSGKSLLDATGGLGIDTYYFSKKIDSVFHCEINLELHKIATHNFKILGVNNVTTIASDGLEFLKNTTQHFDWLYLDPSRRNDKKGKVFHLSDCLPDVTQHLGLLFTKSDTILIKTAPLLDISSGIASLRFVKEIHIVAIGNEVKELLWVLKVNYRDEIEIKTLNIKPAIIQSFDFKLSEEKTAISETALPSTYLYEPNSAILKSGAFKLLGERLALKKLHQHSHLYTSDLLIPFPGRRFKIEQVIPYSKKLLKIATIDKANISTRNFPESVAQIRKKFKIKNGGDSYLFFTTNIQDAYIAILCSKI